MKKKIMGVAALLLLLAGSASATSIGYAKDKVNRAYTFNLGSSTTQGQAIRLTKAKLQALKGKTIDFAEFIVATDKTTDKNIHTFITTKLGGTPIAEGTVKISRSLSKLKWTLDTPYTITGDEDDLYIGYTGDLPSSSSKLCITDGSYDINGYNFALSDGDWVDTYGQNRGSAQIFVNVDGADDYTDAIVGRTNFNGYFKAGSSQGVNARFINAGTTTINSFDAVVTVGGNKTTQHFDNLNIKPKDKYSFTIDGIDCNEEGEHDFNVEIANVNGAGNEIDTSDNTITSSIFFYPKDMEKQMLLESFTGQQCSNCPSGHLAVNSAISTAEDAGYEIVEVTHHAGYYPDMFTMADDEAYTFYYGKGNNGGTYAPAVMVDRTACQALSSFPVVEASSSNALALIGNVADKKPYVSLKLDTEYDEQSRKLHVKLGVLPHAALPDDDVIFNVFLIQDGIQGYQAAGGSNYIHNRAFRGTLTGNSWGTLLSGNLTPGKVTTWETTYDMPEYIHSDYWTDDMANVVTDKDTGKQTKYYGSYTEEQTNIATDVKNMSVVAFVAHYDKDNYSNNNVYNCTEARVGESYTQGGFHPVETGVKDIAADTNANVYVAGGVVYAGGATDNVSVYNLAGCKVENSNLAKGVYIVKTTVGGKQLTKKILVK